MPFKAKKRLEAYRKLISVLTEYVVVINKDFRIISANELFEQDFIRSGMLFGEYCHWTGGDRPDPFILMGGDKHVGDFCYRCWKNRDEKCEDCHVEKCFLDSCPRISEETVTTAEGHELRIRVHATPVRNEEGNVILVMQTAIDIAKRERLEKELEEETGTLDVLLAEQYLVTKKNESKYRMMFERSQDMIVLTDRQGMIEDVNPSGTRLLGYKSKGEVRSLGSIGAFFRDPEDWNVFRQKVEKEGVAYDFETAFKTRDKGEVPVGITANVLFDTEGQILGYEGIARDITLRKRAEQIIRQSNRELAALNAINIASSTLGLDDMLKRSVEEISKLLGVDSVRVYLVDELGESIYLVVSKGLDESFAKKLHIQARDVGQGLIGQVVATGENLVFSDLKEAPSPFWKDLREEGLESGAYFPLMSKGKVLGVIAVTSHTGHDFRTREVNFLTAVGKEVGIAVENAFLYERTRQAYEELKATQEQLIQNAKLASLGKMSAVFAHEINNPIAAILTYVKLIIKILNKPDLDIEKRMGDLLRYLDTMKHETTRCGEIVQNLLTFARQSEPRVEGNDLARIIERTIPLISHDLELKGHTLVVDVPEDLPLVRCDFKQIQQALLNIMINGSEAMDSDGTLAVRAKSSIVKGMVRIDISDTGHGIPEEQLGNIFEPFSTTKPEGKGVGLGLAVVYGIITRHRGQIEVDSSKGKGTTFTIYLPVQPKEIAPVETEAKHD